MNSGIEPLRCQFSNYFCSAAGGSLTGPEMDKSTSVKKEKSGPEPVIIPLVLKMAEFDHKVLSRSLSCV